MPDATAPLAQLAEAARHPRGYIDRWRSAHPGQPVVGVLPMNFPRELALAAGTLPVVVQDVEDRILDRARQHAEACGVSESVMAGVFQAIMNGSVERQYRVGISLREQRGDPVRIALCVLMSDRPAGAAGRAPERTQV